MFSDNAGVLHISLAAVALCVRGEKTALKQHRSAWHRRYQGGRWHGGGGGQQQLGNFTQLIDYTSN